MCGMKPAIWEEKTDRSRRADEDGDGEKFPHHPSEDSAFPNVVCGL